MNGSVSLTVCLATIDLMFWMAHRSAVPVCTSILHKPCVYNSFTHAFGYSQAQFLYSITGPISMLVSPANSSFGGPTRYRSICFPPTIRSLSNVSLPRAKGTQQTVSYNARNCVTLSPASLLTKGCCKILVCARPTTPQRRRT